MTNQTKKLFNAPWLPIQNGRTTWDNAVRGADGYLLACGCFQNEARRIARLPELYDALTEAVYDACQDCLVERSYVSEDENYDLIENGCVYPERDCCEQCRRWIDLLRKVRNGE